MKAIARGVGITLTVLLVAAALLVAFALPSDDIPMSDIYVEGSR